MPYVGFYPCNDPGLKRALRGRKRVRRRVVECITEKSMHYRFNHPLTEAVCFGRYLVGLDPLPSGQPVRIWAYGATQHAALMVYYLVPWEMA